MFACVFSNRDTYCIPVGVNKSYIKATFDLCFFIHTSNLHPSLPPAPAPTPTPGPTHGSAVNLKSLSHCSLQCSLQWFYYVILSLRSKCWKKHKPVLNLILEDLKQSKSDKEKIIINIILLSFFQLKKWLRRKKWRRILPAPQTHLFREEYGSTMLHL